MTIEIKRSYLSASSSPKAFGALCTSSIPMLKEGFGERESELS